VYYWRCISLVLKHEESFLIRAFIHCPSNGNGLRTNKGRIRRRPYIATSHLFGDFPALFEPGDIEEEHELLLQLDIYIYMHGGRQQGRLESKTRDKT
jgi:hypothetical protein